ncbi:hypothetical protein [Mesorhizobium sp. M1406]|uniref:hypothetical protein n=1 Tax=Mesorhizobium sp. M1406 TaxID=2957099 RepID=UPI0033362FF2
MDHIDLLKLLDYTHAQLSTIRQVLAASGHADTMFAIDCLLGAAAEQTRCKLASLEHAGMPVGRHGAWDACGEARTDEIMPLGKPATGSPKPRARRAS